MSGSRVFFRFTFLAVIVISAIQITGCRGLVGAQNIQEAQAASAPSITFTASPDAIPTDGTATLSWNVANANSVSIDGVGAVATTGSMQVNPKATTTYSLHATGAGGQVQASATVTVAAPGDLTFTATPAQIAPGQSATLSWSAANETSVTIDNGVGTFGPSGSVTVTPAVTTSYTATATGPAGTKSATAKVIVGNGVVITQFAANPAAISAGGTASLSWNVTGADTVAIDNGVGTVASQGTHNVSPNATTTYTLTATGQGVTKTATATVSVNTNTAVSLQFSAAPTNISAGQSATLTWSSTNATSVTIDQGVGAKGPNGTVTVTPAVTATYTATAIGAAGNITAIATVNVTPAAPPPAPLAGMFRYKFDLAGTGANLNEGKLNPATVNAAKFGRVMRKQLDGVVFTQPLYVANLDVAGKGTHNVLFLGTEHDIVYALDADNLAVLWTRNFTDPAHGITYVDNTNNGQGRTGIGPSVGITGTPVIDPNTRTLYVSAMTMENGTAKHHLHALDITSGAEKFGGPTEITATVPGSGNGSVNGQITFHAITQNQRSALQLVNGVIYVAFAAYSDVQPYHGWIFAYDAGTMQQLAALNLSPSTEGGSVWQAGAAPVADSDGNIYVQTGDGEFNANTGGKDYGDSFLKLKLNGNTLSVVDWFTPFNQNCLNLGDLDLGASGPMLLPDQAGAHPHLLVAGSKEGRIYVLDRDNMGHIATGSNSNIPQDILINPKPCGQWSNDTTYRMYGTGTYWNGNVYLASVYSGLRQFSLISGQMTQTNITKTVFQGNGQQGRGVIPVISANGATNGIAWVVEYGLDHNITMHAYDATNVANELYNTRQNAGRDDLGFGGVFVVPTVINGKVYVISSSYLNVYTTLN